MASETTAFTQTNGNSMITLETDLSFGDSLFHGIIHYPFVQTKQNFLFLPHNHAFYEMQLVLDDSMYVRFGDEEYIAEKDSLCIICPYEYHTYLRPKDADHEYRLATFSFYIKMLRSGKFEDLDIANAIAELSRTRNIPHMKDALLPILSQIQEEFEAARSGYRFAIENLMKILLIRVFRAILPQTSLKSAPTKAQVRQTVIDRFYGTRYHEAITIHELSNLLHVSDRRTNQLIHDLYGCSFSEKLTNTRLEIAKLYLCYSDYNVAEIALACGFNSTNFFYKTFRRETGYSPREYRKKHLEEFRSQVEYRL